MANEFDHIRNQTIGTVEYVSSREIKVLLDIAAPQNTAINTGIPQQFPKVNGFILIPNELGAIVGIISWIGVEYSPYPKRKGYKDFDLIDLPFPLRKLSVNPLGVLKEEDEKFEIERGVYSYPSVGDIVVVPDQSQLRAIVQNKDEKARVKIGISPMAANAPIYVSPDRVFGRHIAVLGNTGSGKSCSVAGLIRWTLQEARTELLPSKRLNSRFIVLDPNGEYKDAFSDLGTVRRFSVLLEENEDVTSSVEQLKVPSWMWNSYEWSSIAQASGRTQRPILRRTLREIRGERSSPDANESLRRYYSSCYVEIQNDLRSGTSAFKGKPGKNDFGKKIKSMSLDVANDAKNLDDESVKVALEKLGTSLSACADEKHRTFTKGNQEVEYYDDFEKENVVSCLIALDEFLETVGGFQVYTGPDEDSPAFFKNDDFLGHLVRLAQESNAPQFMDFFMMRVKSILTDSRIASVINTQTKEELTLNSWLEQYVGSGDDNGSITIIDLSLLPSEVLFVIVSVLSRIVFEAHQRYRRKNRDILPTTLVVEESHNFIKKYSNYSEEISAEALCSQSFEKIAKEGRKFGLGLVVSSQRPSELSQTVLSQCNTFLLHRLVNDKDQELVRKLVPDNLGSILSELPILPTQKAILLGWAAPIPLVVEMNTLDTKNRPQSKDPEFWDVWTGQESRDVDWENIADEWQGETNL